MPRLYCAAYFPRTLAPSCVRSSSGRSSSFDRCCLNFLVFILRSFSCSQLPRADESYYLTSNNQKPTKARHRYRDEPLLFSEWSGSR